MDVVQAGETVLFRLNDDTTFFSVVDSKTQCHVRKRDFSADLLIGAPYGSVYEAEGGKVQLVESGELLERIDVDTGSGLDNRNTKDTHLSQKLTQGAIVDMKSSGMTGTELISALISNSSTFAAKTSFAQEKYIKKKQLKHVVRFRIERPTAFSVCESLVLKVPARMCGLRGDGIGHLLAGANVRYGARALVFDDTGGVVVGAVIERLGGCGVVIVPAEDQCTNPELAHMNKYNLGHLLRPVKGAGAAAAGGAAGAGAAGAAAAAAGADDGADGGSGADGTAAGAGAPSSAAAAPAPASAGGHRPTFTLATVKYGQLARWGSSLVTPGTPSAAAAAQEEAAIVAAEAAAWKAKSQATYQQRVAAAAKAAAPSWRKVPAGGAAGAGAGAKRRRVEAAPSKPAAAGASGAATSAAAGSAAPTKRAEGMDFEADAEGAGAGQASSAEAEAAADADAGSGSSRGAEGGSSAAEPDAEEEDDGDDAAAADAAGSGAGGAGAAGSDPAAKAAKLKAIKEERAARKAAAESSDPSARHRILPARLSEMSKRFLLQEGLDSIVIVSQYHPAPLALAAVRFAAPSAAISIFCRELQPLAETHRQLRALGLATQLHLTETFYRPHQVLPDRTHPEMVMHGAAGYVLRGVVMLHAHAAVYAAQGVNAECLPSPQAAAAAAYAAAKPAAPAAEAAVASASSAVSTA